MNSNPEYRLEDIFPVPHNQIAPPIDSHKYLTSITNYISSFSHPQTTKHILEEDDVFYLTSNFKIIHSYRFHFFPQFLSVVVLSKNAQFAPILVSLLYFKKITSNILIDKTNTYQFLEFPQGMDCYELGQLPFSSMSLDKQSLNLGSIIAKKSKEKVTQYTPFKLKKLVEESINLFPQSSNSPITTPTNTLSINFPDINHQFCYLIFSFLFGDKISLPLLLSFKLNVLFQQVKKIRISTQQLTKKHKLCLKQLLLRYKRIYNAEISMIKYASEYFNEINNKIQDSYKMNDKKTKQMTIKALKNSFQEQIQIAQPINCIIQYCKFKVSRTKKYGDIGFRKPLSIPEKDKEKCFRQLIKLYNILIQVQKGQFYWVKCVERCFFELSQKLDDLKINTNEIYVEQSREKCNLHKVVSIYEGIMMQKYKDYNFGLKNQGYSTIYLIRQIASVIAFELLKKHANQNHIHFPFQKYRIEVNSLQLYTNFTSLNYDARQALEKLQAYRLKNQNKLILISLDTNQKSNKTMNKMAEVYCDFREQRNYLDKRYRQLQENIDQLNILFQEFHKRYDQTVKDIQTVKQLKCSGTDVTNNCQNWYNYCKRCKDLKQKQKCLQQIKRQTFLEILAELPQNQEDAYLFSFFANLKGHTLGAMKMIYQSEVPLGKSSLLNKNDSCLKAFEQLVPYSKTQKPNKKNIYQNIFTKKKQAKNFVIFQQPINIFYYTYDKSQKFQKQYMKSENYGDSLSWMLQKCDRYNNKTRQHTIYANLNRDQLSKDKQFSRLPVQQFKVYASIRVTETTQLIMLAQAILSRNASPHTLKKHQLQKLILLNAAGNINSFKNIKNIAKELTIIRQSVKYLLQNYLNEWNYKDLYSIEIVGIILSLLSKLISQPQLVIAIAKRAFEEYVNVKKENSNKATSKDRLKELYILHSIMSCFSQNISKQSQQACIIFGKIMVNYRINQAFSHSNQLSSTKEAKHIQNYKYFFEFAKINNIHSVVEYFQQNPKQMREIIAEIDQDISRTFQCRLDENNHYVFKGSSKQNKYQINIFDGILLKNGKEVSKIPAIVKSNPQYALIFGEFADLEIFTQEHGQLRTRTDFQKFFKQENNTNVFFQFIVTPKQQVKIRLIFKRQNEEQQKYLLVPHQQLQRESILIPELYMKQYQCWVDQRYYRLIFRKKTLNEMNKIGLILMNNRYEEDFKLINQGRIITNHFENRPINYLTDEENQVHFDHLLIVDKNTYKHSAIEVLSGIQDPKYIIQVFNIGQKIQQLFWLHRCDLKFAFDQEKGLVSLNFQGYLISVNYNHHHNLPWKNIFGIKCLILRKYQESLRSSALHEYMLLISNQNVSRYGKIQIVAGQIAPNPILSCYIHDNFKDLGSNNRLTQLHLICLIASFESAIIFEPITMTNEQYCIDLIRSCYSNIPFNLQQQKKVLNIIQFCIINNLHILLLCCQVMCSMSNTLKGIFAFPQIQQSRIIKLSQYKNKILSECKYIYNKRQEQQLLSIHQRLNNFELTILGITKNHLKNSKYKIQRTSWYKKERYVHQFQQKTIANLKETFPLVNKLQSEIVYLKNSIINHFEKEGHYRDNSFVQLQLQKTDKLAEEMILDIKSSIKSYCSYSQKYERLELSKKEIISKLKKMFIPLKNNCQKHRNNLIKYLMKPNQKAIKHLDFIAGNLTLISPKQFTKILCNQILLQQYYHINEDNRRLILQTIKFWMLLTLQIQSLTRISSIFNEEIVDRTALFRQLQSPRDKISEKNYWICFEAEMKIRIWQSQYDTYKHLRDSESGSVSQLNMGEGKTQVIIPMIVLDNIYSPLYGNPLSRINILSQLFQEAQSNYFRFFSVTSFRIPIFSIYFNRDVQLTQENTNRIKYQINILRTKMLMLIDRESCLSMVLRVRESVLDQQQFIDTIGNTRDEWMIDQRFAFKITF